MLASLFGPYEKFELLMPWWLENRVLYGASATLQNSLWLRVQEPPAAQKLPQCPTRIMHALYATGSKYPHIEVHAPGTMVLGTLYLHVWVFGSSRTVTCAEYATRTTTLALGCDWVITSTPQGPRAIGPRAIVVAACGCLASYDEVGR